MPDFTEGPEMITLTREEALEHYRLLNMLNSIVVGVETATNKGVVSTPEFEKRMFFDVIRGLRDKLWPGQY